jgi:hypothetical protein
MEKPELGSVDTVKGRDFLWTVGKLNPLLLFIPWKTKYTTK